MRILLLLFLCIFPIHVAAEVYLSCKPLDKQIKKNEVEQDFLIVVIEPGFSNFLNIEIKNGGVYKYSDLDGKFYRDGLGRITQENIIYFSSLIKYKQKYSSQKVSVSRKNLEARVYKKDYVNRWVGNGRIKGTCEIYSMEDFQEIISSKIISVQSDNIF